MKKYLVSLTLMVLLIGAPVIAQEATDEPMVTNTPAATEAPAPDPTPAPEPEPTPDPAPLPDEPPVTTPGELLERLFEVLKGTYIGWAAAGTLVIVGLLKVLALRFLGLTITGGAASTLAVGIQVIIWLLYNVAQYFGAGLQFQEWYLAVVEVLKSLLPLAGALFLAHEGYGFAARRGTPVMGYKPPKKVSAVG